MNRKIPSFLQRTRARIKSIVLSPVRAFKFFCFWIGFFALLVLLGLSLYLNSIYQSVPNFKKLTFPDLKVKAQKLVYDKLQDKNKFKTYRWAPINEISRDCIYTIVSSEDSSFFDHDGIDVEAILNSMAENIKKRRYEYGASTISQQVVKNLFLTNEKSIGRKLKELLVTEKLEHYFTKNEILELYLNLAEFGPDLFGIREASQQFFKKAPAQINAAEGAFIAIMLPSPRKNYYSIFLNRNIAPSKRKKIRRILGDMLASEFISQQQYQKYIKYPYF